MANQAVKKVSELNLNRLTLIHDNIEIVTEPFAKNSFFVENGHVKIHFDETFKGLLEKIPDTIPAFQGKIVGTRVMHNKMVPESQILYEVGYPDPFSIEEFAAIMYYLLSKQPNGEEGILPANGYANFFYIGNYPVLPSHVTWYPHEGFWAFSRECFPYCRYWIGLCFFFRR